EQERSSDFSSYLLRFSHSHSLCLSEFQGPHQRRATTRSRLRGLVVRLLRTVRLVIIPQRVASHFPLRSRRSSRTRVRVASKTSTCSTRLTCPLPGAVALVMEQSPISAMSACTPTVLTELDGGSTRLLALARQAPVTYTSTAQQPTSMTLPTTS